MISVKVMAAVISYCAAWTGFPHYKKEIEKCDYESGHFYAINARTNCRKELIDSDINSDQSGLCRQIVVDCVKDLGSFSKCKNGKWKWYWGEHDADLKKIVDEIADFEYAPDDVKINFRKESRYFWRKKIK